MLCDTGPLVAVLDEDDSHHARNLEVFAALPLVPLRVTWACLTEAMHLLRKSGGHADQEKLWRLVDRGEISVLEIPSGNLPRIRALMAKYQDAPMDFADASLIVAAEQTDERQIITFDKHFYTFLIYDKFPFEVFA
jgi:predicted nucleic acid-binding protein